MLRAAGQVSGSLRYGAKNDLIERIGTRLMAGGIATFIGQAIADEPERFIVAAAERAAAQAKGGAMTTTGTTGYRIGDARAPLWFGRWPAGWGEVVHGVAAGEGCSAAAMIETAGLAWTV
jgi:hypothetical protein